MTLAAVNAATGDTIAQDPLQGTSKGKVLSTLGQAAAQLQGKLGESLSSIARLDKPLEEATTSSLEALCNYTLGEEQRQKAVTRNLYLSIAGLSIWTPNGRGPDTPRYS